MLYTGIQGPRYWSLSILDGILDVCLESVNVKKKLKVRLRSNSVQWLPLIAHHYIDDKFEKSNGFENMQEKSIIIKRTAKKI